MMLQMPRNLKQKTNRLGKKRASFHTFFVLRESKRLQKSLFKKIATWNQLLFVVWITRHSKHDECCAYPLFKGLVRASFLEESQQTKIILSSINLDTVRRKQHQLRLKNHISQCNTMKKQHWRICLITTEIYG